ncbi:phosphoribosylamine--glycine ligase [Herbivorax sp. ANBcel31]|uniref:phosphoribosylamine--glycine ligase n=1 Tax=Herbivorax sp. ANBcel31 TaxID=3069754 RepID=UPI0027ADCC72|nr:phosphoribosylamine--glycine ligase [Herbivorax sp. ANBcel31]MDQ2087378.1 phosphoribosylamine--glycine ligase [Herbivorax sp. ANBcel31]
MKVLIVGSGGREHALVWKIAQSALVGEIYCAPGNGGISSIAQCVPINIMDIDEIVKFSKEKEIDMVVVASENPLAAGMVDELEKNKIRAFGPSKAATIIEGSKSFSKELMKKYGIPTAEYEVFDNSEDAISYLKDKKNFPIVVKADGLALGKGVIIAESFEEAEDAVKNIMDEKAFGDAGNRVIIEEFLIGQEVSVLAFTDGKTVKPMVSSQDHKRALDNDEGLNTGGMGTFSPSRIYNGEVDRFCMDKIYKPTIEAMNKEGRKFKGILYFGLIITEEGPKVIEYNARFGDPEAQVVLPRLQSDILEIFNSIIDEKLDEIDIKWDNNGCVCVIMASGGYPKKYEKGFEISGLDEVAKDINTVVFHAGTKKENNRYLTAGGRVIGVTALESSLDKAIKKAYEAVEKISFKNAYYRKDIGVK